MVHYVKERDIDIKISTNLSLEMEDGQLEALLRSGLQKIYISCNEASSETYLKYHVVGDFELVMDNVKRLVQKKQEIPGCRTGLVWLFHVFKHNEHEIDKALERDKEWIPENPEYTVTSIKRKKRVGCMLPWTETVITWDGSVLTCCAVYSEKHAFGNIRENSFREIWNNKMYHAARKEILGMENDKNTICHICKRSGYLHGG